MECWNKKCGYKGKPEWGTFQDAKCKWIKYHIRCPKCKCTNVCMTGLEGLEHEIRHPRKCSGVKGETKAHPTVRKVINIHSTGYSIGCPICGWGMATGGSELDKKEVERLKKMYAESLSKSQSDKKDDLIKLKEILHKNCPHCKWARRKSLSAEEAVEIIKKCKKNISAYGHECGIERLGKKKTYCDRCQFLIEIFKRKGIDIKESI